MLNSVCPSVPTSPSDLITVGLGISRQSPCGISSGLFSLYLYLSDQARFTGASVPEESVVISATAARCPPFPLLPLFPMAEADPVHLCRDIWVNRVTTPAQYSVCDVR